MLVLETRMYPLEVPGDGIFRRGYQKPYSNKKIKVLEFLNTRCRVSSSIYPEYWKDALCEMS